MLLLLSLLALLACRPDDAEHCDGLDNDGDGLIDDDDPDVTGLLDWHADADGDSFGDPDTEVMSCRQPGGHVADKTDCDDSDASVRNAPSWYADVDGDRFGDPADVVVGCVQPARTIGCDEDPATPLVLDCDDTASWVHPGAAEVCDGVDDDCDGLTDDEDRDVTGQVRWYPDADGDGYGLAGYPSPELACDAPAGWVDDQTDCEDTIAAVNPGADEICDDIDDDCDGLVDGQDDSLRDAPTWYADADGDGYGDANVSQAACHSPPGAVIDATDCNDSAASANPGATEVCDDLDNDCDRLVDAQDDSLVGGETWYPDADGDGQGDPSSSQLACNAPAGTVADNADCDDSEPTAYTGASEICDGIDNDCDTLVDQLDDSVVLATWFADADGDGYGDAGVSTEACEAPAGFVSDGRDCDDADASVGSCGSIDDGTVCPARWGVDDGQVPVYTGTCDTTAGFSSFGGHCYFAVTTSLSPWDDARATCALAGGYLTAPTDRAESTYISWIGGGTTFAGGCDDDVEGTWTWVSGEPWSFSDWASGEPNGLRTEDCLEIRSTGPRDWNDSSCDVYTRPYVCEFE